MLHILAHDKYSTATYQKPYNFTALLEPQPGSQKWYTREGCAHCRRPQGNVIVRKCQGVLRQRFWIRFLYSSVFDLVFWTELGVTLDASIGNQTRKVVRIEPEMEPEDLAEVHF